MLRIHFGFDDLARTRVGARPHAMWEIVLSVQLLQNREGALLFDGWRRTVRDRVQSWVRPLMTLAPHATYFPDFLTPAGSAGSPEEDIEAVLATPRARVRAELELLGAQRRLPEWTRGLAAGDLRVIEGVGHALRSYHDAVLRPEWSFVEAHIEADRARRMRAFAEGGVEGLLGSYSPLLRWNPPILEADYPVDRELMLEGRGLLLLPSYFCCRAPVTLVDPELAPVLVYPVARDIQDGLSGPGGESLAALVGRNRAAIMKAIGDGCSTTELSRRAGTSIASASQHTAVLREAGLVTTQRNGSAVLHNLTPLGSELLSASEHPDAPSR
ncbi:winged helix-turn-helix domain-containing protein [Actinomadura viridis]|uniref:DNA-binding transcriptional ArsR family regulator n=1 Tax=Actinomadura viridis TaxID=58110 RepID=A0A931DG30_9ACTN|nr:winged helix-turn-helix domain-containing protein [Actinomadura viridis]MBG6089425.1 DNA-binding transcriptional ArsR family regulator [Actinomadura viridis]